MTRSPTPSTFVEGIAGLQLPGCFNPYTDNYTPFDLDDAPAIRRANLTCVLAAAASTGVDDLWVGLELGHKGGRRTGLAMTDDRNLSAHGRRFGVADQMRNATRAGPTKELTAGIVWEALGDIQRTVFLWNVVPLHPHRVGEPLSNRRHTAVERLASLQHLEALIALLKPERVIAVGKDASTALTQSGIAHMPVRHPAFGGKRDFVAEIGSLMA